MILQAQAGSSDRPRTLVLRVGRVGSWERPGSRMHKPLQSHHLRKVPISRLFQVPAEMSPDIENKHLETFTGIWQSHFMFAESNILNLGCIFLCPFSFNFSSSSFHCILSIRQYAIDSLVAQTVKNLLSMQETQVWSLGWEDPTEKGTATHYSILACRIPRTVEPGRL